MSDSGKEYLTPQELADKLGMSIKFIRKHTQTGRIPGIVRCGRMVRYNEAEIHKRLLSGKLLLDKE